MRRLPYLIVFLIIGVCFGLLSNRLCSGSHHRADDSLVIEERKIDAVIVSENDTKKIKKYLESRLSPLADYAGIFTFAGSKYGVDPFLLVAISGIESSFGKNYPKYTHNPFGIGSHHLMQFDSLDSAILYLAQMLAEKKAYAGWQRNKENIAELSKVYCPPNKEKWQRAVEKFIREMKNEAI